MEEYFYEHNGVRLRAVYDDELDGLILCGGNGEFDEWYIPKAIDGTDIKEIVGETMDFLRGYDRIIVDEDNMYFSTADGVLFKKDRTTLICYPPGKCGESYVVPDEVKTIGDGAFNSKYLKRVILSSGLEKIAPYAFSGCRALEEIYVPKGLKHIYLKAFNFCENLRKVYYEGSREEREQINFTSHNDCLTNAHINYNCQIYTSEKRFKGGVL